MTRFRSGLLTTIRWMFLTLLPAFVIWALWSSGRIGTKPPPPPAAGNVRVSGSQKPGIRPRAEKLTDAIFVNVQFVDPDDGPPMARLYFFENNSGVAEIAAPDAREGDEFAVGKLRVRVTHLWWSRRAEYRAADLEIVNGGTP